MSGFMGSFLRTSEWIMRLLIINAIWLLFNLPIVYLMLDMFFRNSIEEVFTLLLAIILLLPFVFFPATTAMFALVRRWIIGKGTRGLFTKHWYFYKQNYFRSVIGSIPFLFLGFLWVMNYRATVIVSGSLIFYVYVFVAILFFGLLNYFFSDMVHFDIGFFASLQKVGFMAIFYMHYTLGTACAAIIVVGALYLIHPILILLFAGASIAYIYFFAYYQIYLKAKEKERLE